MIEKSKVGARVLAIAPTTRGFGYVVFQGRGKILAFSTKKARGEGKNTTCLKQIEELTRRWLPDAIAIQDVDAVGSRRAPRIKALHGAIEEFAGRHSVKVCKYSGIQLRKTLLDDPAATKHDMAVVIARLYPEELAEKLPPKRRAWEVEGESMGVFDAAALGLVHFIRRKA